MPPGPLHAKVAALSLYNFVVRPQRQVVEKYAKAEAWQTLSGDQFDELSHRGCRPSF